MTICDVCSTKLDKYVEPSNISIAGEDDIELCPQCYAEGVALIEGTRTKYMADMDVAINAKLGVWLRQKQEEVAKRSGGF